MMLNPIYLLLLSSILTVAAITGETLRILPLGASIASGVRSTDGNGYRYDLVKLLAGNTVTMIGSLKAGTMPDNNNEGHSGATIAEVGKFTTTSLLMRPNVVLLHAGTNDLNRAVNPGWEQAPTRLAALIDQIIATCPDAVIMVAQIVPSTDPATQARIEKFNSAIPGLVSQRVDRGRHVMAVDMFNAVTTADLSSDGIHPNDGGYMKMANAWFAALEQASKLNWITLPMSTGIEVNKRLPCQHNPTWTPQNTIINRVGLGKNMWPGPTCVNYPNDATQCSCQNGGNSYRIEKSGASCIDMTTLSTTAVRFADLNGDGRAEYLWVDTNGAVTAFLNQGGPDHGSNAARISWNPQGEIAYGVGGNRAEIHFADINGDGRADYLWVHSNGSVSCWLNLGGSTDDGGPNSAKVGWAAQGLIFPGFGKEGAGVRFADLNGDGRAEYLYLSKKGSVTAFLNTGAEADDSKVTKIKWVPQGIVANSDGKAREDIVFTDINGDGRADFLELSELDGSVKVWFNLGGPDKGANAAKIFWSSSASTISSGMGKSVTGAQFADLTGDGRAEYLDVDPNTSAVDAWLNSC